MQVESESAWRRIAISAKIENEMADRIRGVAAVTQQIFERLVARDGLVLAKRFQQVIERLFRNIKFADGLFERDKHGMPRIARIAGIEFGLPLVEHCSDACGIADFIAQIV